VDLNTCSQSRVPVHFELSAVQWRSCCALFDLYVFLLHSYSDKKKQIHGITKKQIFLLLKLGEREAECLVFKPGTYVSVANKGALDL